MIKFVERSFPCRSKLTALCIKDYKLSTMQQRNKQQQMDGTVANIDHKYKSITLPLCAVLVFLKKSVYDAQNFHHECCYMGKIKHFSIMDSKDTDDRVAWN